MIEYICKYKYSKTVRVGNGALSAGRWEVAIRRKPWFTIPFRVRCHL